MQLSHGCKNPRTRVIPLDSICSVWSGWNAMTIPKAADSFQKAAMQGLPLAQQHLGELLKQGHGRK